DEGGTGICGGVSRDDVEDVAALFVSDPTFGERLRAVERAVEHDTDDGVEGVGAERFGGRHEVAGCVVDERVDAAELVESGFRGGFDCGGFADVGGGVTGRAAGATDFFADLFQRLFATADDENLRAEFGEFESHAAAEAGAAAGDEDGAVVEGSGLEHEEECSWKVEIGKWKLGAAGIDSGGCSVKTNLEKAGEEAGLGRHGGAVVGVGEEGAFFEWDALRDYGNVA